MGNNMTKETIVQLVAGLGYPGMPINSPIWKAAFDIYNSHFEQVDKSMKLSMNCRPCYAKVAAYLVNNYLIQR